MFSLSTSSRQPLARNPGTTAASNTWQVTPTPWQGTPTPWQVTPAPCATAPCLPGPLGALAPLQQQPRGQGNKYKEGVGWRLDGDYQMIKMHKFSVVKLLEFNKILKKIKCSSYSAT